MTRNHFITKNNSPNFVKNSLDDYFSDEELIVSEDDENEDYVLEDDENEEDNEFKGDEIIATEIPIPIKTRKYTRLFKRLGLDNFPEKRKSRVDLYKKLSNGLSPYEIMYGQKGDDFEDFAYNFD